LIVEVGSGDSISFAWDAMRRNGFGHIISIDSRPRTDLPRQVDHLVRGWRRRSRRVRQTEEQRRSVHRLEPHDEARFHSERNLPDLGGGVIITTTTTSSSRSFATTGTTRERSEKPDVALGLLPPPHGSVQGADFHFVRPLQGSRSHGAN
jgi:hypothetical protein